MGTYMEDLPIVLPVLEGKGVERIGDLWNCQTSTPLGINIFDKELTKEDLKCFPQQKLDYKLTHIKNTKETSLRLHVGVEMKMEIFFGLITIRIGWGHFESTLKKSFHEELLSCDYQLETFRVKTLPNSVSKMNPKLKEELLEGNLKATHMLAEVVLGADISGLIRIIKTNTDNPDELSGNFFGKMVTAPISVAIKALQSLLAGKDDGPKSVIEVKSIPEISPSPTNIEDMFSFINKIESAIESEKHFPMITSPEVTGAPILYILLPISKFLPDAKIHKLYKTIEANVLDSLTEMSMKLKDMEKPGFFRKQILEWDLRLSVILSDSENPFSKCIAEKEGILSEKATKFKKKAKECLELYKKGEKEAKDLDTILEEYWDSFNIISLCQDVENFIAEGKKELGAILIDDLEINTKESVLFITSEEQRQEFLLSGRNMKLLLNADTETKKANIFLSLYKISSRLKDFGVDIGVEMPNVSSGFSLSFRLKEEYSADIHPDLIFDEITAPSALQTLAVAIDSGEPNVTRFYHVLADLLGFTLPLEKNTFGDVTQIIKKLKDDLNGVDITETILELRNHTCCDDDRLKFVLTLDSLCTLSESVEMFRFVKRRLKENYPRLYNNSNWIVGKFGVEGYSEGPFLFLFKNKELQAICLDKIDVYILLDILETNSLQDSPLLPSKIANSPSFHYSRANYALHVLQMFEEGFSTSRAQSMSSIDPIENKSLGIENFRKLLESVTSKNEVEILSTMTDICTQFSEDITTTLQSHGWDAQEKRFLSGLIDAGRQEWATDFKNSLEKFFVGQTQFMEEINLAIKRLKKRLRYFNENDEFTDENEIDLCINAILDGCDATEFEELHRGINSYRQASGRFKYQGYLNVLEKQMNAIVSFSLDPKYFHLRSIINFLDEIFIRRNVSSIQTELLDIIEQYLHTVQLKSEIYEPCMGRIKDTLKRGSVYQTLMLVAKCQYSEHLFLLHSVMESSISSQLNDATNLKKIIRNLKEGGFSDENFKDLWSMPKFYFLMSKGRKDKGLLETINAYLCGASKKIPSYLPKEFVEALKLLILDAEEIYFDWNKDIKELNDILQVFQEVAIRSLIPKDLQEILTNALNEFKDLKEDFLAADNVPKRNFFWDDVNGYFKRPWDVESIKEAVEPIMTYMNKKTSARASLRILITASSGGDRSPNGISKLASPEENKNFLYQMLSLRNCNFVEYLQRQPVNRSQVISNLIAAKFENTFEILHQMNHFHLALPLTIYKDEAKVKSLHSYLKLLQIHWQVPQQNIMKKIYLFSPKNRIITVVNLGNPTHPSGKILNGLMKKCNTFSESSFAGLAEIASLTNTTCSEIFWEEITSKNNEIDLENATVLINVQGNILDKDNRKLFQEIRKISSCFVVFLMPGSLPEIQNRWKEMKNIAGKTGVYFKIFIDPQDDCKSFGNENIFEMAKPQNENLIAVFIEALKTENSPNPTEKYDFEEFQMVTQRESLKLIELVRKTKVLKLKQMLLNIHDPSFQSPDTKYLIDCVASILNLDPASRKLGLNHLEIELRNLQEIVTLPLQRRINEGHCDDEMNNIITKLEQQKIDVTLNVTHFLKAMERILASQDQKTKSLFEQKATDIVLHDGVDIELIQGDTWELQSNILEHSTSYRTFVISVLNFDSASHNVGGLTMKMIHLDESLKENLLDPLEGEDADNPLEDANNPLKGEDAKLKEQFDTILMLRASFSNFNDFKKIRQILSLTLFHSHVTFIKLPSGNEKDFSILLANAFIISTLFNQIGNEIQSDVIFIDDTSDSNFGQNDFPALFNKVRSLSEKWEMLLGSQSRIEDKYFKVIMRIENKQMIFPLKACTNESCSIKPNCFNDTCTKNLFQSTLEVSKLLDSESFLNLKSWMKVFRGNWDIINQNEKCKFLLTCQSFEDIENRMNYLVALSKTRTAVDAAFRFHRLRLEDNLLQLSSKKKQTVNLKDDSEDDTEWLTETCDEENCLGEKAEDDTKDPLEGEDANNPIEGEDTHNPIEGEDANNPIEGEDTNNPLEDDNNPLDYVNNPLDYVNNPLDYVNNPLDYVNNPLDYVNNPREDANNPLEDANNPLEDANNPLEDANNPLEDANNPLEDTNNPLEGDDANNPFEGKDANNPFEGKYADNPLEGEDANNPLEDTNNPLEGDDANNPFEGKDANNPFEGKYADNPLEGEDANNPLEEEDVNNPLEGEDANNPLEGEDANNPLEDANNPLEDANNPLEGEDANNPLEGEDVNNPFEDANNPLKGEDANNPLEDTNNPLEGDDANNPLEGEDANNPLEGKDANNPLEGKDANNPLEGEDTNNPLEGEVPRDDMCGDDEDSSDESPKLIPKRRHRHKKRKPEKNIEENKKEISPIKNAEQIPASYEWVDWEKEIQTIISSIQLYPFICKPEAGSDASSVCHCAEVLTLKQDLSSTFKSPEFSAEVDIDEYIKQISIATISKLTQMVSSLDMEQRMRAMKPDDDKKTYFTETFKQLLDYKNESSEEVLPSRDEMIKLKILGQHFALKILVLPSERSVELDLVKEYGKTIADKIRSINSQSIGFNKIKAFEKSGSESAYLSQKEIYNLKYEISRVTQKIVKERQVEISSSRDSQPMGSYLADTYESGSLRELKEQIEKMLEMLFPKSHNKLSLAIKWKVHAEAVRKLNDILNAIQHQWDQQYNPLGRFHFYTTTTTALSELEKK